MSIERNRAGTRAEEEITKVIQRPRRIAARPTIERSPVDGEAEAREPGGVTASGDPARESDETPSETA